MGFLQSGAASAAFNSGRIMDDGLFNDSTSMSAAQIDAFLNSKNSCISTNSGFSARDPIGYSPSTSYKYGGNVSAGTIIAHAAQAYDINPKVLITTLQKEQSLITSTSCSTNTIAKAVGYGCPDGGTSYNYSNVNLYTRNGTTYTSVSGVCVNSSSKVGFTQQLIRAAWLLKFAQQRSLGNIDWAIIRGNWDNSDDLQSCYSGPMTQGYRKICPSGATTYFDGLRTIDGTTVQITTGATAALYWYTPHFHGNQNFVNIFEGWFGSTQVIDGNITMGSNLQISTAGPYYAGQTVTATYQVKNTSSVTANAGGLGICGRIGNKNSDFGFTDSVSIAANGTATITYSKTLKYSGALNLFVCSYNSDLGGWANATYPYNTPTANVRSVNATVQDNPLITTGVALSPASPVAGQTVNATMTVRNYTSAPVNIGTLAVGARDPSGKNVDFPAAYDVIVPANGTYTYSKSRTFESGGNYSLYAINYSNGSWNTTYPKSASGISRSATVSVQDNPQVTVGIAVNPSAPKTGQSTTATLTIRNYSSSPVNIGTLAVAARGPSGQNVDFPAEYDVIVPANGTYTYSKSKVLNAVGTYSLFIANYRNGSWNTTYPKTASGVPRQINVNVTNP
jgi:hypothetical protein